MKSILVPTDFSQYSEFGITSAIPLAKKTGAKLILLHVLEKDEDSITAEKKLERLVESESMRDVNHEYKIAEGNHINSIVEEPVDLIVMGSKGAHGFTSFFKGTNAEKVAKSADCPVITLKHHQDLADIRNIVYPTDLRNEQEAILDDIRHLQLFYEAHLQIIKVFDSTVVTKSEVEKRLRGFAEFHQFNNYSINARDSINEADEILSFAEEINADLIAMATHDRHGLGRLVGGYISGNVIKHATTGIWTKVISS